ncbi:MAG: hypothetical protein P9M00_13120 [Candidatus Tritonobacter lacicola]|nr:hypothetical protein [Candidatus Tritonobacter lacicola]
MRNTALFSVFLMIVSLALGATPIYGQEAKPEQMYDKAERLLGDAKRDAQAGGEVTALEKYGEALIVFKQVRLKDPSWKPAEVDAAVSEAEAGYIRAVTSTVVSLQNMALQREAISKQQAEIIEKLNLLVNKNAEMMKFLTENRDLIESIEGTLGK